jgi:hypothetical protein
MGGEDGGGGAQAPARPVAGDGIADLAAGGEAHAQSIGGKLRIRLQDETWRHRLTSAGGDLQEFGPSGEALKWRHAL